MQPESSANPGHSGDRKTASIEAFRADLIDNRTRTGRALQEMAELIADEVLGADRGALSATDARQVERVAGLRLFAEQVRAEALLNPRDPILRNDLVRAEHMLERAERRLGLAVRSRRRPQGGQTLADYLKQKQAAAS